MSRDLCKKALPSTAGTQTQVFGCFLPKSLLILPKYPLNPPRIPDNQASEPPFRQQQAHLACWPLSTGSNTSPSDAFGLRFRQRMVAVGFAHNAVQQPMFFQMLPVFLAVIAFVGIDGRTFGNAFQQRRQVVALMGIGGGDVQFLNIAFLIGTVLGEFCKGLSLSGLKSLNKRRT